jgi:hypothetical protein
MERIIDLYRKGNAIISWRSFYVGSCFVLSDNYYYMCCRHQNTMHQICMSWIHNDHVHQGSKTISGDDNIHSFLCMAGEKVGNLFLYVNSIL